VRTRERLFSGRLLTIDDYVCQRPLGEVGALHEVDALEVLMPREGSWMMHADGRTTLVDPSSVALLTPGRDYRNSHPLHVTSRSTAIGLSAAGLHAVLGDVDERPLPRSHAIVPVGAGHGLLHRRLLQGLHERGSDLAVEETALHLAGAHLRYGRRARENTSSATARRHRELVEATKTLLNRRIRSGVTLSEIAAELAVSPYHLSRVFTRRLGVPIYRYFLRLRLLAVMERILAGDDITRASLDHGFSDHSHLTNRFRREFGIPPSHLRDVPGMEALRARSRELDALGAVPDRTIGRE